MADGEDAQAAADASLQAIARDSLRLLDSKHPAVRQDYALFTPAIDRLYATIKTWIENRITGGYVWGTPRLGKSRAVRYWLGELIAAEPDPPAFFRTSYRAQGQLTERGFFEEMLAGLGHELTNGRAAVLLERLLHLFRIAADDANGNHVVLVIDEAQNMTDAGWRYLCTVQNRLDDVGVRLTVVSVGSHELAYQHGAMVVAQDVHLTSRFMVHAVRFEGVQGVEELEFVLRAYDEGTEWPAVSGLSYTAYFFPAAYLSGFRLSSYAEALWRVYRRQAGDGWERDLEVAMEHVAHAVEHVFRWALREGRSAELHVVLEQQLLEEAVSQTGFSAYMRTIRPLTRPQALALRSNAGGRATAARR